MRRIEIGKDDVVREPYRGSGPGGQHRNKTETGIRLRHISTGVTVQCCTERSQSSNEANAWKMLRSKLARIEEDRAAAARAAVYDAKPDAGFGRHIRTYRACGNHQVTLDHRTGVSAGTGQVLRGQIDQFLTHYPAGEF